MKKRFLSAILCLCMVLTLIPTVAFAVGENEILISQNVNDNDSFATATTISVNSSPYTDNLATYKSVNYYKFTTSSNGYISIDFGKEYNNNSSRGWDIYLYDSSQKELMERTVYCGDTETKTTCKLGLSQGTYYIKIKTDPNSWIDISYNFKVNFVSSNAWETEFNDEPDTADKISINTAYYGSLREYKDSDYYKFTTTSNGYISIDFGKEYNSDTEDYWKVTLYNSSQKELMNRFIYCGDTATTATCKLGLSQGTYYIKITTYVYNWTDVSYNFKVNFVSSSVWETEFNDEPNTANNISINTTYYGSSHSDQNVDYFKFTLNSPASVYLSFGSELSNSTSKGWTIKLYNSFMQEQTSYAHECKDTIPEVFSKIQLSSGLYYIKVIPYYYYSWTDVTYNLKITNPSAPTPTPDPDPTPAPSGRFTDVPSNAYYAQAVEWAVDKGIVAGTSSSTFAPNQTCTRAQVMTMLWNVMNRPNLSSSRNPFTDVPSSSWYTVPVLWAYQKGITSGTSSTTFSPSSGCTRAQVMTFIWNQQGKPQTLNSISFTDVSSSAYYYQPVRWAVKNGITSGTTSTTFSPNKNCTRAEVVMFLYKVMA